MKKCILNILTALALSQTCNASVTDFFHDTAIFTKEIFNNQREMGAIFACSSFTAQEITRYIYTNVPAHTDTYYILEIGPGTGVLTEKISKILETSKNRTTKYVFDVVEINENLCKHLMTKFYDQPNINIHCCSITEWKPTYRYNCIISTLPHNSLDTELVKDVIEYYKNMVEPNGYISYIEYIGGAKIKKLFLKSQQKAEFTEILRLLKKMREQYGITSKTVMLNLLPLYVHHLHFTGKEEKNN